MALRTWNQTAIIKYLQTAIKNAKCIIQKGYNENNLSHLDSKAEFILRPNLTSTRGAKLVSKRNCSSTTPSKVEDYKTKLSKSAFYKQNETIFASDVNICKNNFSTFSNRRSPKLIKLKRLNRSKDNFRKSSDALTYNTFKQNTIAKRNELHKKVECSSSKKQNSDKLYPASTNLQQEPQDTKKEKEMLKGERGTNMTNNSDSAENKFKEMEEFFEKFTKKVEDKIKFERQKQRRSKKDGLSADSKNVLKKEAILNKNPEKLGKKHHEKTQSTKNIKALEQDKESLNTKETELKISKTKTVNKADTPLEHSKKLNLILKDSVVATKPTEKRSEPLNDKSGKEVVKKDKEKRKSIIWYQKFSTENVQTVPEIRTVGVAKENATGKDTKLDTEPMKKHVEMMNTKTNLKQDQPKKINLEVAIKPETHQLKTTVQEANNASVNEANGKNQAKPILSKNELKGSDKTVVNANKVVKAKKTKGTNSKQVKTASLEVPIEKPAIEDINAKQTDVVEVFTSEVYKDKFEKSQCEPPKANVNLVNCEEVQAEPKESPKISENTHVCSSASEVRESNVLNSSGANNKSELGGQKIPPFEKIEGADKVADATDKNVAHAKNVGKGIQGKADKGVKVKINLSAGKEVLTQVRNANGVKEAKIRLKRKNSDKTLPASARNCAKRKRKSDIRVNVDTFKSPEMEQRKRLEFQRSHNNLSGTSYIPKRKLSYVCGPERKSSRIFLSQNIKSRIPVLKRDVKYYSGLNANAGNNLAEIDCAMEKEILARSMHTTSFLESRTVVKKLGAKKSHCRLPCKPKCTPPNIPKREQCEKVRAPYKSFAEMNCLDNYTKPTECPYYIELQPGKPVFSQVEKIPVPEHMVLDPEFEEDCVRRKLNIKRTGTTVFCSTDFTKPVMRQKEILKIDRPRMCRYMSRKSYKDCSRINSEEECEVFHNECDSANKPTEDLKSEIECAKEEAKILPKEQCESLFTVEQSDMKECLNTVSKFGSCPTLKTYSKTDLRPSAPFCPPQHTVETCPEQKPNVDCCQPQSKCCIQDSSSSCDSTKSMLQRLVDYFKARPNCPSPNEWKRKMLREKAEKAAKAAGLSLCDPNPQHCKTDFRRNYSTYQNARPYTTTKSSGKVCKVNRPPCGPKPKVSLEEKEVPKFNHRVPLCGKTRPRCSFDEMPVTKKCSTPRYPSCPPMVIRERCNATPLLDKDCCSVPPPFPSFSECYRQFPRLKRHECQAQKLMVTKQKEAIKNIFKSTWIED